MLTCGDHGKIAAWRRDQSLERTRLRRPDLYEPIFAQLQQAEALKKNNKRRR